MATEELALAIDKLEEEKWMFSETAGLLYASLDHLVASFEEKQQEELFALLKAPLPSRPYR